MSGPKSTAAKTSTLSNIRANSVYVAGKNAGKKDDKDSLWCDHC